MASQHGGCGEAQTWDLLCPVPLSFLLELLGFCVVCWNWVCEEGNAVLWNLVLSDLCQARSHNSKDTCAKTGTGVSLTGNVLSF